MWEDVLYTHEDIVTGTVVSYRNDGTSNTGFVSEQNEPLGQSISLSPPPVEPEPPTYEAHLFDAYDPEWQCSVDWNFYGGFNGLPDHCQNKILKNLGLALKDIFGWHPSSVSKIVDSPLPGYVGGGSDGMAYAMGRALSSSSKLSLSGGTKTVDCPDTDSADGTIRVCTSINGLRDKNRSGPSLPNDIDQRLDASNGGDPLQAPSDIFELPESVSGLKKLVTDFFKEYGKKFRRCSWKVFATDSYGDHSNVAAIMEKPSSQNFPYENVSYSSALSAAFGVFSDTDGSIIFRTKYRSSTLNDGTMISGRDQFFRTLAHEYANFLSWYYSGSGATFGTASGILGNGMSATGLRSVNIDYDTGARMEECIWGNTSF